MEPWTAGSEQLTRVLAADQPAFYFPMTRVGSCLPCPTPLRSQRHLYPTLRCCHPLLNPSWRAQLQHVLRLRALSAAQLPHCPLPYEHDNRTFITAHCAPRNYRAYWDVHCHFGVLHGLAHTLARAARRAARAAAPRAFAVPAHLRTRCTLSQRTNAHGRAGFCRAYLPRTTRYQFVSVTCLGLLCSLGSAAAPPHATTTFAVKHTRTHRAHSRARLTAEHLRAPTTYNIIAITRRWRAPWLSFIDGAGLFAVNLPHPDA